MMVGSFLPPPRPCVICGTMFEFGPWTPRISKTCKSSCHEELKKINSKRAALRKRARKDREKMV